MELCPLTAKQSACLDLISHGSEALTNSTTQVETYVDLLLFVVCLLFVFCASVFVSPVSDQLRVLDNGTLVITDAQLNDSAMYVCRASNEAGVNQIIVTVDVLANFTSTSTKRGGEGGREGGRDRQTERQTDRERETDSETDRERQTDRQTERDRQRD